MRTKALYAVLSKKLQDGEILFVDALTFEAPKTKDAKAAIMELSTIEGFDKLATKRKNAACIAACDITDATEKSFRNFGNITLDNVRNLNPATILTYKYLVLVGGDEAVKVLSSRGATKKTA
jgi:large subunit ribosomal protein L4